MSVVTMSQFGKYGRFGNQLFQYAFLKQYTALYPDCELQIPPWVGCYLFGLSDSPIQESLPKFVETGSEQWYLYSTPPNSKELLDHNFHGYAQYHTSYFRPFQKEWRKLFTASPGIVERLKPATEKLLAETRPTVGIHLRRGDYGQFHFYITPVAWYLQCLAELNLKNPLLFIASETPSLAEEFRNAGYEVVTSESLGVSLNAEILPHYNYLEADKTVREPLQLDFYPDFHLLSQCSHLLMPNSSFSFAAAMLSKRDPTCYRSSLITGRFHRIDPWDDWPLQRDSVDDYSRPGTYLEQNLPYWPKRRHTHH